MCRLHFARSEGKGDGWRSTRATANRQGTVSTSGAGGPDSQPATGSHPTRLATILCRRGLWTYEDWVHKYARVHRDDCRALARPVRPHQAQWVGPLVSSVRADLAGRDSPSRHGEHEVWG